MSWIILIPTNYKWFSLSNQSSFLRDFYLVNLRDLYFVNGVTYHITLFQIYGNDNIWKLSRKMHVKVIQCWTVVHSHWDGAWIWLNIIFRLCIASLHGLHVPNIWNGLLARFEWGCRACIWLKHEELVVFTFSSKLSHYLFGNTSFDLFKFPQICFLT